MICIFEQTETDFSGNGIGPLCPTSCEVSETLNGEYELKMEHPIDAYGKWLRIQSGRILRVPVPAAMTPQVHLVSQTTTDIYKTNGSSRPLRAAASAGSKKLAKYKKNKEVIKIAQPVSGWYEVIGPDGKRGYMQTGHLTFVRTDYSLAKATGEVVEPSQMRDQPFRIYRIVPELDRITVHARHLFYDLRDNMIKSYVPDRAQSGAAVVEGISAACLTAHEFRFYSDIDTVPDPEALEDDKAIEFTNVNPIDALLGDDGFIPLYGGELARDWFDVYMVKRVGVDSGVQIREGKNLLGISYDETDTDVVTRIMPTGEDKDGELLYLPELYVDSPNIEAYANPKWHHLPVSDCKENPKKTKDNPKKTKEQCYTQMRDEAQKLLDSGCDLPTVTLNVDFVNCAETEEYRQYAYLQNIYLGDGVRVITKRTGIRVTLRMTEYTFDCLTRKYTKMTLGTIADGLEANTISPRQIPAGSIGGSKLAINSVGVGQMQEGSVGSLQIQDAAIGNAHIQNAAIKSANIDSAAILYAHIAEAAINQIKAGSLEAVTAKIESLRAGDIVTDRLAAALAAFTVITAGNAQFDAATIGHLVSNFFNLDGSGSFEDVYIYNLVLTYAQIAAAIVEELALKGTDGHYYRITVTNGQLSPVLIPDSEIDEQTGMTTDGTRSLIDSALSQLDMTSGPTIKGIVGVINRIYASVIDADALFAREAIIAKLRTTQIVGDKTITMIAEDTAEALTMAENAGHIWRGTAFPTEGVRPKDLFVKTDTNEVYQSVEIGEPPEFYYDADTGVLYYDAPADAPYRIWMDENGYLNTEGIQIELDAGMNVVGVYGWTLVRDQYIVDMALAAQETADEAQETADTANATANAVREAVDALIDVVDGKTTTYYSSSAPSDAVENDIWYDTATHKIKRRLANNTWQDITSEALYSALSAAGTAQATADGKIVTFAQTTAPTAAAVGDLWIDTDDNNKLYRWNGTSWVAYRDTHLDYLIDVVDGKTTTYYGAQPSAPSDNDIWYDTANGLIKRYANNAWVDITNSALKKALDAAGDAQATADGKIRTFAQTTAPTGMTADDIGDLWIDTDDNNRLYRWNGTRWDDRHDLAIDAAQSSADAAQSSADSAQSSADAAQESADAAADKADENALTLRSMDALRAAARMEPDGFTVRPVYRDETGEWIVDPSGMYTKQKTGSFRIINPTAQDTAKRQDGSWIALPNASIIDDCVIENIPGACVIFRMREAGDGA